MADIEVRGADEFYRLSRALKSAGRTDLRKNLHKAMRDTAKPLVRDARDAALTSGIPSSGGLAARIAKSGFRTQVRTGAATAGVRITAPRKAVTARLLNETGRFRHPVHADGGKTRREWAWVAQEAPSAQGWFDRAMKERAPKIRRDLLVAMDRTRNDILRSIR